MFFILSIIISIIILIGTPKTKVEDKNELLGCRIIGVIFIIIVYRCLVLSWIPVELAMVLFSIGITLIIKPVYKEEQNKWRKY